MILATLLLFAVQPQDTVTRLNGDRVRGQIQEATLKSIRLTNSKGKEVVLSTSKVLSLALGALPAEIQQGLDLLAAGQYDNAVALFGSAAEKAGETGIHAGLLRAEALLRWGRMDSGQANAATTAFRDWLASYPDHFDTTRATLGLARALASQGKTDEASRELEGLASLAFERNLPSFVELRARLERCRILLLGAQAGVATTRLQDLVPRLRTALGDPQASPALRNILRKMHGEGQVLLGEARESTGQNTTSYWDGLLRDSNVPIMVRAAATLGQARAALASGRAREAQFLAARVVATYSAGREWNARALFELAQACSALQDIPFSSKTYYRQLVKDYPETSWAQRARTQLDG